MPRPTRLRGPNRTLDTRQICPISYVAPEPIGSYAALLLDP
jgi:hypothetical protein